MALDNKLKGEQNRLAILTNLHRFGWLTSTMLAALVWPTSSQGMAMTRRMLRTLLDAKLILKRPFGGGPECITLSAAGARLLAEQCGIKATSGASLQLGNVLHRACSNWYVIGQMTQGLTAWTEHEIQTGHAPLHSVAGKVPDALIETGYGLIWVEVENAWKNRREREKVLHFCTQHLSATASIPMAELAPGHYLFRVVVVSTTSEALRAIVRTCKEAHEAGVFTEHQAADVELVHLSINSNLSAGASVSGSLWYDALSGHS